MEDDLDPTQGNASRKQWGRGAAPHTTTVQEPRSPTAQLWWDFHHRKSQLCWNRPGKGMDVPVYNKGCYIPARYLGGINGRERVFPGLGRQ